MSDNDQRLICPACHCEMEKVYIPDAKVNVDICTKGCGGIYFDNKELNKFDERYENANMIFEALENKRFIPVDKDTTRI